jgi:hypothetical protein
VQQVDGVEVLRLQTREEENYERPVMRLKRSEKRTRFNSFSVNGWGKRSL